MSDRDEFEKAYDSGKIHKISRDSEVVFEDFYKHVAWSAWQAARQGGEAEPVALYPRHGFIVEDYNPVSKSIYQYTLRDTDTGEAIAPLSSEQGLRMKMALAIPPAPTHGVPEVPTETMLAEGVEALIRGLKSFPDNYTQIINNVLEDMHAAAQPPKDKREDFGDE